MQHHHCLALHDDDDNDDDEHHHQRDAASFATADSLTVYRIIELKPAIIHCTFDKFLL